MYWKALIHTTPALYTALTNWLSQNSFMNLKLRRGKRRMTGENIKINWKNLKVWHNTLQIVEKKDFLDSLTVYSLILSLLVWNFSTSFLVSLHLTSALLRKYKYPVEQRTGTQNLFITAPPIANRFKFNLDIVWWMLSYFCRQALVFSNVENIFVLILVLLDSGNMNLWYNK